MRLFETFCTSIDCWRAMKMVSLLGLTDQQGAVAARRGCADAATCFLSSDRIGGSRKATFSERVWPEDASSAACADADAEAEALADAEAEALADAEAEALAEADGDMEPELELELVCEAVAEPERLPEDETVTEAEALPVADGVMDGVGVGRGVTPNDIIAARMSEARSVGGRPLVKMPNIAVAAVVSELISIVPLVSKQA
jgi:hypothetical protein